MRHKSKRRWALVILLVGLPAYVVVAISIIGLFERPSLLLELFIYVALGILWALPFRRIFSGVGRDAPEDEQ